MANGGAKGLSNEKEKEKEIEIVYLIFWTQDRGEEDRGPRMMSRWSWSRAA